ncbi:MAG: glycosyltransferase family 2 protein [Trueperaceae bacterium]
MTIAGPIDAAFAALFWAVAGFLALKLGGIAVNLFLMPKLRIVPPDQDRPTTAILVPVRDEAENLPITLPRLLAQDADAIVLLDDASSDDSFALAREIAGDDPRVQIVRGRPLPDGWTGKTWACHQLSEATDAELLVFTDADVRWEPGALDAVTREMRRQRADAFSVFPRQRATSLLERTLLPLIDDVLLSFLPFPLLRLPIPAAAAANGQLLAFRRDAYHQLGGHRAVRGEIVEDIRLGQRVRRAGLRLGLSLGADAVEVRMYRSDDALVQGLAKSLLAAHGGSRALLTAGAVWHGVVYTAPLLLLPAALLGAIPHGAFWALPIGLALIERVLVNHVTGRGAPAEALLMPLAPLAALPVYRRAMAPTRTWKGRDYPT